MRDSHTLLESCVIYLSNTPTHQRPNQSDDIHILEQMDRCLQIARSRKLRVISEFKDKDGVSNPFGRSGFNQLLGYVRENKIRVVVIASADSITAEYSRFLEIEKKLASKGVRVVCPNIFY